ncbi:MAG TPA: glycosyltransferase family 39 protein [Candidatus Binataceae bacterium]|nr:glycosyltransferase family 39 protein [Candidatus Binataceae bacterium]
MAVGAVLRLPGLGAAELSPDEAASWLAANAPTLLQVLHRQAQLNPGKLPLYEVVLHGWIGIAGEGVGAMRGLALLFGLFAIALTYYLGRELMLLDKAPLDAAERVGLSSALLFAVSLVMVKYARQVRMYELMLALVLAQSICLLAALRRASWPRYLAIVALVVLALGANMMAVWVFAAQGLWLLCCCSTDKKRQPMGRWGALAALVAGVLLTAPMLWIDLRISEGTLDSGALLWIHRPDLTELFSFFNRGSGTFPFPILALLAIWGVIARWRTERTLVSFALFWMWLPVVMLLLVSWLITPMLVERYALTCFVPFFVLAALGVESIKSRLGAAGALGLLVALSVAHTVAFLQTPLDNSWRRAADAIAASGQLGPVLFSPPAPEAVMAYYLGSDYRFLTLESPGDCAKGAIFVLWDHDLGPARLQAAKACAKGYRTPIYHHADLTILGR